MKTRFAKLAGIDYPIVAFTHCRDVLIAVTRAGGLGVLGTARTTPEQLEVELTKIDEALGGMPYGVDILFPASETQRPQIDIAELEAQVPPQHRAFAQQLIERFHIPKSTGTHGATHATGLVSTLDAARERTEVMLRHPVKVLATALGPAPADVLEAMHRRGGIVGGLVGSAEHARRHVAAGAEFIVAEGTEAGGHTGEISTMVLVPEVVDAVPVPVLAAGGIGGGRQVAAALALGAEGVWTGSIWLTTIEGDDDPIVKEKLLKATSRDTIRSRCASGKPVRQLRTPWVMAWESKDSPGTLPMPLQGLLVQDIVGAIYEHRVTEVMGTPVGQIVGQMNQIRSARDVFLELVEGFVESATRLSDLIAVED